MPYYNIAFVNYIRIAAAMRAKAMIAGRLLRLETLLDAGGEKKTVMLKMLKVLKIVVMIVEGGAAVLLVLEK